MTCDKCGAILNRHGECPSCGAGDSPVPPGVRVERRVVQSFTVRGPEGERTYASLEEVPEQLRRQFEAAMASP